MPASKSRMPSATTIIVILIICVVGLGFLLSRPAGNNSSPAVHPNDRSPLGGYALAQMLSHTGFSTKTANTRLSAMPSDARVWFILDPDTHFSGAEATQLLQWIKQGGIAFLNAGTIEQQFNTSSSTGISKLREAFFIDSYVSYSASGVEYSPRQGSLPPFAKLKFDAVCNYRTGVKIAAGSGATASINGPHFTIASPLGGSLDRISYGRGQVFVFPDAWMLCNYGMTLADNAVLTSNLIRVHALSGTVYFDERQHGDAPTSGKKKAQNQNPEGSSAPQSPWQALFEPPLLYGLLQAVIALIGVAVLGGRRLGTPIGFAPSNPTTRASHFAAAMGSLLYKVRRPQAAGKIIGEHFRARLARRVGLSPAETDVVLARRAHEISGIPFDVLERLLLHSRAPSQSEAAILSDAQEMDSVLRVLEGRN